MRTLRLLLLIGFAIISIRASAADNTGDGELTYKKAPFFLCKSGYELKFEQSAASALYINTYAIKELPSHKFFTNYEYTPYFNILIPPEFFKSIDTKELETKLKQGELMIKITDSSDNIIFELSDLMEHWNTSFTYGKKLKKITFYYPIGSKEEIRLPKYQPNTNETYNMSVEYKPSQDNNIKSYLKRYNIKSYFSLETNYGC